MRRITLAFVATVAVLILLFSYRTSTSSTLADPAPVTAPPGPVTSTAAPTTSTRAPSTSPRPPSTTTRPAATSTTTTTPPGDAVVNGSPVRTHYGIVQVQIHMSGSQITDVTVLRAPTAEARDREINAVALPILREEALAAQSAQIDTVSGATFTSDGYIRSLQAAIDSAAHN